MSSAGVSKEPIFSDDAFLRELEETDYTEDLEDEKIEFDELECVDEVDAEAEDCRRIRPSSDRRNGSGTSSSRRQRETKRRAPGDLHTRESYQDRPSGRREGPRESGLRRDERNGRERDRHMRTSEREDSSTQRRVDSRIRASYIAPPSTKVRREMPRERPPPRRVIRSQPTRRHRERLPASESRGGGGGGVIDFDHLEEIDCCDENEDLAPSEASSATLDNEHPSGASWSDADEAEELPYEATAVVPGPTSSPKKLEKAVESDDDDVELDYEDDEEDYPDLGEELDLEKMRRAAEASTRIAQSSIPRPKIQEDTITATAISDDDGASSEDGEDRHRLASERRAPLDPPRRPAEARQQRSRDDHVDPRRRPPPPQQHRRREERHHDNRSIARPIKDSYRREKELQWRRKEDRRRRRSPIVASYLPRENGGMEKRREPLPRRRTSNEDHHHQHHEDRYRRREPLLETPFLDSPPSIPWKTRKPPSPPPPTSPPTAPNTESSLVVTVNNSPKKVMERRPIGSTDEIPASFIQSALHATKKPRPMNVIGGPVIKKFASSDRPPPARITGPVVKRPMPSLLKKRRAQEKMNRLHVSSAPTQQVVSVSIPTSMIRKKLRRKKPVRVLVGESVNSNFVPVGPNARIRPAQIQNTINSRLSFASHY
ncbi:unnamed protein product [Caenorhabditis auriculariae]|uniref:Uncharacterized protein n=1 Tax=Caenorhabditis auriculariae TaxID=2777116 RepID=A0A8S1HEI8_9PELO|nr:unnamed protein product [Caenorhabditis auriculariae]